MEMIYKNDTLYIDLLSDEDILNIDKIKRKVFSVLSQYQVDNVVINVNRGNKLYKNAMNSLVCDYHKNFKGNMIIDIK